jgi:hypothetical protein
MTVAPSTNSNGAIWTTERAAKKAEEARAEIKAELRALRASFEAERDEDLVDEEEELVGKNAA